MWSVWAAYNWNLVGRPSFESARLSTGWQNRVILKEQVVDFAPQPVITKDNVTMRIDTVVFFQITDPKLFAYGVENPHHGD